MDTQQLARQLESALTDEFDRVGITASAEVSVDEDIVVIALSGDQAQALVDALNRAEDTRR